MLIEQVDCLDLEPLERALDGLLDVLRAAVQSRRAPHRTGIEIRIEVEPELGGDHHLLAEGSEGLAHKLLVDERAVDLGGVEEGDAPLDGGVKQSGHLLLVFGRAVGKAHSHAAEAEGRDFQIALSKFTLLHCRTPTLVIVSGHCLYRETSANTFRAIATAVLAAGQPE